MPEATTATKAPIPTSATPPPQQRTAAATPRFVTAHLRHYRMSPRKLRLVAKTVTRMPAVAALDYLKLLPKAAAAPLAKLIASAVANAGHNFQIAKQDLLVAGVLVNQGPTLKRWRPRAFGRAGMIRKRSSHLTVTLVERPGAVRKPATPMGKPAAVAPTTLTLDELKRGLGSRGEGGAGKAAAGETPKAKSGGFRRKLFQRKAG